ncbi:MAG TPA: choice-of-anchor Q domain-containing protein, partial [Polyangiaceae bacterium]|nr:choice-of-anchor Q domain-containing protein [Polyangiaceae bacterium]
LAHGGLAGAGGFREWSIFTPGGIAAGQADATGGAIAAVGPLDARQLTVNGNRAIGGASAECFNCMGSSGRGGGLAAAGRATLTDSTFALNQAASGARNVCRNVTVPNPQYPGYSTCLDYVIRYGHMPGACQIGPNMTATQCGPADPAPAFGAVWSGDELTLVNTSINAIGTAVGARSLVMDHATIVGTASGTAELFVLEYLLTHRSAVMGEGMTLCRSGALYRESSYNRFSDASCSLSGPGDVQGAANFALGPIADNGGPVATMLPGAGSVLIDAIPRAACTLTADARGVSRPQGSGCDVGAVEVAR